MKIKSLLARQLVAEFIGTFTLVFVGCGAIIVNSQNNTITNLGIAFVFGLVIMVMISVTGHISMAHFNPAVTFAFALTGNFSWKKVIPYWVSQLSAAISGAFILKLLFGPIENLGATLPSNDIMQSFWLEIIITSILMFVIIAVATDQNADGHLAAIMIGATVMMNALWAGPISGASMNPARSFGPAFVSGLWTHQWIYWIAPIIGATIGAMAYSFIHSENGIE